MCVLCIMIESLTLKGKLSAFTVPVFSLGSWFFQRLSVFYSFAFAFFQKLNPLQELQLLEIMCNYFQEQTKDSVRQVIFSSLFSPQGNKADDSRMALLGKLVSMAVAVCRVPVLECAAFWLQVQLLCRQGWLGEGVRQCSRMGTVSWGTTGYWQLLLPGSFS